MPITMSTFRWIPSTWSDLKVERLGSSGDRQGEGEWSVKLSGFKIQEQIGLGRLSRISF